MYLTVRTPTLFALAFLCLGPGAREAAGQGGHPPPRSGAGADGSPIFRLEGGVGVGSTGSENGAVGAVGSLTFAHSPGRRIILRGSALEEFALFRTSESVWDLGVLYGVEWQRPRGYFSVAAGPALAGGTLLGERLPSDACPPDLRSALAWVVCALVDERYREVPFTTLGLAFQSSAGWTPTSRIGLAVTVHGNLNGSRSAVGVSLGLLLGNIR